MAAPITAEKSVPSWKMDIKGLMLCGFIARIGLLLYGEWQDRTMAVKFTDVDYQVFTDAARHMTKGESPYLRATYRYTPLLAWMLQPNIWLTAAFGKLLFIVFDVATGYLIHDIVEYSEVSPRTANICAAVWLFNPLPMTVSSRGNAESIMSFLVLLIVKFLLAKRVYSAGFTLALSIHVKIYPVTYAIPIYLLLSYDYRFGYHGHGNKYRVYDDDEEIETGWFKYRVYDDDKEIETWWFQRLVNCLWPTKYRIVFVTMTLTVLGCLTSLYYYWYGWEFLYHTYLYHVTRKDIRHNFSVYFYMLYQQSGADNSVIVGLVTFLPQVILLLLFSAKFYLHPQLVFFLNTFVFVTFNKVCTSQYFLWYLCLLPTLIPHLKFSRHNPLVLFVLWFGGQGIWLLPAYYLEFEGINTFLVIWLAGLIFFAINCYILSVLIDEYTLEQHIEHRYQNKNKARTQRKVMSANTQRNENNTEINSSGEYVRERIWTRSEARKQIQGD